MIHEHIWTTTSPTRGVECGRYLVPWWRRLDTRMRVAWAELRGSAAGRGATLKGRRAGSR
jgi:hypothetical protein